MRTKTVKRSARLIVERYYAKLTSDFHLNKRLCDEVSVTPSKRMRNKIAGFVTHLIRRIERGDNVRGISLKLQEEERERRMDYVPDVSALKAIEDVAVDKDTKAMLMELDLSFAPALKLDSGAKARRPRRD